MLHPDRRRGGIVSAVFRSPWGLERNRSSPADLLGGNRSLQGLGCPGGMAAVGSVTRTTSEGLLNKNSLVIRSQGAQAQVNASPTRPHPIP